METLSYIYQALGFEGTVIATIFIIFIVGSIIHYIYGEVERYNLLTRKRNK